MAENCGSDPILSLIAEQRDVLQDLGFKNPLINLGSSRCDTGFEIEQSHTEAVAVALMSGEGRLTAAPTLCCGSNRGATFEDRLRSVALTAESLEADVGLNLLKVAVGAVVWRDPDQGIRESPIWLRAVRIIEDEWVAEGAIEINELFLARVASAGLKFDIDPHCSDLTSIKVREDAHGVFVRFKNRVVVDLFATAKFALWKSLDFDARPEILTRGALRLLAGGRATETQWEPGSENRYVVPADPAQAGVISAARRGESLCVQGPPGTGKSQTVVNVVANVVADGRTVLVAADKTAAIEVVAARLQAAGIPFRLMLGRKTVGDEGASAVLTTPAMAVRFLPPNQVFDLVVVDEASQMPLPNALSLATRADRMLVFGDARQMGPNLRAYRPTEKSPKVIELASILDQCAAIGLPEKTLTHHYRSQHPDLIFFSDVFSYGSSLMTSPHPTVNQNFGVFLIRLMGVTADEAGGSIVNNHEAAAIVDLIVKNLTELKDRNLSLGVITMNRAQRDLVASLLAGQFAKMGKRFSELSRVPGEPFFVRSIDSVQGEERDVVILGLTYGRKPDGQIPQILGAFSAKDGLQRLNVAMSRSRKQTYVVTSLQETDLEPARLASHALYNALLRSADCRVEPFYLPDKHPLGRLAKRNDCSVQLKEGVFGFLHKSRGDQFVLGVYLSGLRGDLEDSAELSRLRSFYWRLEVLDAADALENSQTEDFFASWNWPIARLEDRLKNAIFAARF